MSSKSPELSPHQEQSYELWLSKIKDVHDNAETRIENELERSVDSPNVWPSAFNTNVGVLWFSLDMLKQYGKIHLPEYTQFITEIRELEEDTSDLFKDYPEKNSPPPQVVKDAYLNRLETIAKKIYAAATQK